MDTLLSVEAYSGYCKALQDMRGLIVQHDLKLGKKPRQHLLGALDCILGDPDRLMIDGGRLDLWWREDGKKIVYFFEPPDGG